MIEEPAKLALAGPGRQTVQAQEPEFPLPSGQGPARRRPVRRTERPSAGCPEMPAILPYTRHQIDEGDIEAVTAVLRSSSITQGPAIARFERALANRCGAVHAIAVNSGTSALYLAARALGLGSGTVTIVPAVTFLATANAVTLNGGKVVFADVDPRTGLMNPQTLQAALQTPDGRHAQAAIPVHYAGALADMEGMAEIARHSGLTLIEDAAHAIGSTARGSTGTYWQAGSCRFSTATCFSFHPAKTIAAGEAGAVLTNDEALARSIERGRNHGVTKVAHEMTEVHVSFGHDGQPNPWSYEMDQPGFNFRLSEIHAALGQAQLTKLEAFKERRRQLAAHYRAHLLPLYPLVRMLDCAPEQQPAWHLCGVRIDFEALGVSRAHVMRLLAAQGIQTQVHYIPLHFQPFYKALNPGLTLPGAEAFYRRTLSLPFFTAMTEADVARTVHALRSALNL